MESSASAGRVASAVLDPRRWRALALLCGAFFMLLLNGTITIVALPSIGAGLRFSEQGSQWVLSACALTFGGLLLLGGRRLTCPGAGFRPAAATGLALMAAGALALTQVFIHGSCFPDIFVGLLLCGLGIGLALVTPTVAALAGVAEHETGLASGLSNTALPTGTALGVAIVTTVAVCCSQHYLAAHEGANPLAALAEGYQSAFLAGRDRPGAGVPAPRLTAEANTRAARAGPGGRCGCRCRRRRGDQARNAMSEQRTDSYHPRRLRRR